MHVLEKLVDGSCLRGPRNKAGKLSSEAIERAAASLQSSTQLNLGVVRKVVYREK